MVQRLTAAQIAPLFDDLELQGMLDFRIPEPVSRAAMQDFCVKVAESEAGYCYGWFEPDLVPHGFFVGLVSPDPLTGKKLGIEFAWWMAPKWRGRPSLALLKQFEDDCRKAGCERILLGMSNFADRDRRHKLYARLGYADHSETMFKEL